MQKQGNSHEQEIVEHLLDVVSKKLMDMGILHSSYPRIDSDSLPKDYVQYKVLDNSNLYLWVPKSLIATRPAYATRILERYKKYIALVVKFAKPIDTSGW